MSGKRRTAGRIAASQVKGAAAPVKAADRKAAIQARSGVERAKPQPAAPAAYPIGKGRKSLKGVSIYMHPLAKEVLDAIAQEQSKKIQDLGLEALNLLFLHYGKKPVA